MSDDEGWDSEAFARLFPDYDAMMAVLVELIHASKEAIVANGPDDLEPLAILGYDNGLGMIMVMADNVHPAEALGELLASSPLDGGQLGHARFLVLCVEAYASRDLDHVPARGELALRFSSNDPRVTEVVSVNYVDDRGYRMMSLPFHYGDG